MKLSKINPKTILILLIAGALFLGAGGTLTVQSIGKQKAELRDSIVTLNTKLTNEHNRYLGIIYAMDSVSRKGGQLTFTNNDGIMYDVFFTPKAK